MREKIFLPFSVVILRGFKLRQISGGMNGYLSLSSSSPVVGMDDIMDNQAICAIFMLPDYHNHLTRPPVRVKILKKTIKVDDLQPDPILWQEKTKRKPWNNE
ncbi:5'-3' exoribonuclease 3-like protein, partial [Tanacetum coccineum]